SGLQQADAERAFLRREVRSVIRTDAVLVADRATVRDDGFARRALHALPVLQRVVGVGLHAEDHRHIDARAGGVDVRQVREDVHALAERLRGAVQAVDNGLCRARNIRPGDDGLQRIDGIARLPERVAQVGRAEAALEPYRAHHRPDGQAAVPPRDVVGLAPGLPHAV